MHLIDYPLLKAILDQSRKCHDYIFDHQVGCVA